jgi:hypothetical protein
MWRGFDLVTEGSLGYHFPVDDLSWYCLKEREEEERDSLASVDTDEETEEEESLFCAACGFLITLWKNRISVDGSFEHTFVNPGGYIYRVGCFREAQGCLDADAPTKEHTWFKDHAWQYAVCGSCLSHLGWVYSSGGDDRFYGLILDKLSMS